jgi:peptidoglycan/LPS O-acetylase OafA/YrhL
MHSGIEYRREIDGLRAIAVLSVIFFHLNISSIFSGGYVGVDVFFVISGYLITKIIRSDVSQSKFSFATFYTRRARRLLPAYFVCLLLCLIGSAAILSPPLLKNFGGALIYSIYSIQNFYQILSGGYFDLSSSLKPLLHTWSLSVEEQFYLVWPLTLVVITKKFRPKTANIIIGTAAVASLLGAYIFSSKDSSFYFTPFRFFEFAIGASLCLNRFRSPPKRILAEASSLLGLVLVMGSITLMNDTFRFPSFWTLLPCLGTWLLIYGGGNSVVGRGLSFPPLVKIGLLSYSLYLVHWPLFVLYQFYKMKPLTPTDQLILLVATFAISTLIYFGVEKPLRYSSNSNSAIRGINTTFFWGCAAVAFALILPAAQLWANNGWPSRFPKLNYEDFAKEIEASTKRSTDLFVNKGAQSFPSDSRIKILVLGDSHSVNILNSILIDSKYEKNVLAGRIEWNDPCISSSSLNLSDRLLKVDRPCNQQFEKLKESGLLRDADIILVANWWTEKYFSGLKEGFVKLKSHTSAPILLVGQNEVFPFLFHAVYKDGLNVSLNTSQYQFRVNSSARIDAKLARIANEIGLGFVSRRELVCQHADSKCSIVDSNNVLLYRDDNHWSYEGEQYFGSRFVEKVINNLPDSVVSKANSRTLFSY